MKALELVETQRISLDILKVIDTFCKENGIIYSLSYGTLIGAIRHKGFIPWDDDIDIVMPRSHYLRFIKEFKDSKKYKLFAPEKNNSLLPFGKLCEMELTVSIMGIPWRFEEAGVGIDIFPLDGLPNDEIKQETLIREAVTFKEKIVESRYLYYFRPKSFINQIKLRTIKLLKGTNNPKSMINDYISKISERSFEDSPYWGNLALCYYPKGERQKKEDFQYTIEVEFEGYNFSAMNGWDNVLRLIYGDYMQLPSEEKRIPKHIGVQDDFWK